MRGTQELRASKSPGTKISVLYFQEYNALRSKLNVFFHGVMFL